MSSTVDAHTLVPLTVVPVFGRIDLAVRALSSIDAATPPDVEVLVIDDAGPARIDDRLVATTLATGRPHRLIRHERNVGFVASVNEAASLRAGRDLVVVNSDVVVFADWLVGLQQAAQYPQVASVTALTNRGSIATLPEAASAASAEELRPLAEARAREPAWQMPLSVAVGHCLLLADRALTDVGAFDLAFSPGYGEEVDWSIRASRRGWRHVAASQTVVWHDAAASFGPGRQAMRRRHELRLALRYPREFVALRRSEKSR